MKSEPQTFSWQDLEQRPKQTAPWDGVRNYQVRNFIRDTMQIGEQAFFYHSSCATPAIIGIVKIISDAYPDPSAFDINSEYFDNKSNKENPRWLMRDVKLVRKLNREITLRELKELSLTQKKLADFPLLKRGNRLSIIPLNKTIWTNILALE